MTDKTLHQESKMKCLPLLLDPRLTNDQSLICICGHYINCHEDGLSCFSPCQEDEGFCGCLYPEVDVGETVRETYFYKGAGKIAVDMFYSTQDFSRYRYMSSGGLPVLIESRAIPISAKVNLENYRDFVITRHGIHANQVRKL